jgi:hypothetical protein
VKVAATVLYEDSHALRAVQFGLHDVIVRLIADEMPDFPVYRVANALDCQPMKGVARVLDALLKEPHKHAPNGRRLVGCVDDDQLLRALHERNLTAASDVKTSSPIPEKVDLFALARNTESLLRSAASLVDVDAEQLNAAIQKKSRSDRDVIFRKLAKDPRRQEWRKRHPGVDALVGHLVPLVAAFLQAP